MSLKNFINKHYQVLLSLLSGLLLFFSFPKFGNKIFAWFSLVPLIFSVLSLSEEKKFFGLTKKVLGLSLIMGIVSYFGLLYWIIPTFVVAGENIVFGIVAVLLLSLYCSLYIFLFCLYIKIYEQFIKKYEILFYVSSSALWVVLEYLRSYLFSGFPWVLLGYSQYNNLFILQLAEYFGVYGISFILIFTNIFLAYLLYKNINQIANKIVIVKTLCFSVMLILIHIYGGFVLKHEQKKLDNKESCYNIVLLQGNIDQYKKWDENYKVEIMNKYYSLIKLSYENLLKENFPVIFIWPESSVPGWLFEDKVLYNWLSDIVRFTNTNLISYHLVGTVRMGKKIPYEYYNSAVLFSYKNHKVNVEDIYDKIHLVPFGEYVPLRNFLSKFIKTINELGEFTAGRKYTVFKINDDTKFSVLICYETIFPELVSRFVNLGANFIVNITNDAWFLKTSAPYQHFIFNIFRAVENRTYVLRAANTGISAVIAPTGKILQYSDLFEDCCLIHMISFYHKKTFYTKFAGYLFCVYFLLFLFPLCFNLNNLKFVMVTKKNRIKHQQKVFTSKPFFSILYICNGNVFRSVFAEGYTKHLLAKYGIDKIEVRSCGVVAEESFKVPKSLYKIFELYNIKEKDLKTHIPTKINKELLATADLVLVMEKIHLEFIKQNFPEFFSKTFLLKEYAGFFSKPEIFDPIGQPENVYLQTVEEIKICVEIIIKNFVKK